MKLITNFWFIQFIGIIALVFITLAWNAKTRKKILDLQGIGGGIFVIHFLLLNAYTGALINVVMVLRNLVFAQRDRKRWANSKWWLYVFIFLSVLVLIFFWQGWPSILPVIGLIVGTYGLFRENPKEMRFFILLTALVWIPYTIIVHSYSGLLNHVVSNLGLLVGMYRLDRKKLSQ